MALNLFDLGSQSGPDLEIMGSPSEVVHLNDELIINRGFLQRVRDCDNQSSPVGLNRKVTAAVLDREVQPPCVALNALCHLPTVNFHRRPFESVFNKVLLIPAPHELWICRDLLLLVSLTIFVRIMSSQRHFDIAAAVFGTERSI